VKEGEGAGADMTAGEQHTAERRKGLPALPQVVTALAVVALVATVAVVARRRGRLPETPEAAVNALFDAAGRGDDAAYLRLVTGRLRDALLETRRQMGREAFCRSLRQTTAGVKGLAVSRLPDAPAGTVAMKVEIIFADRNERQRLLLVEQSGGWAIAEIEKATMVRPPIPYGTPVFEEPLEVESRRAPGS